MLLNSSQIKYREDTSVITFTIVHKLSTFCDDLLPVSFTVIRHSFHHIHQHSSVHTAISVPFFCCISMLVSKCLSSSLTHTMIYCHFELFHSHGLSHIFNNFFQILYYLCQFIFIFTINGPIYPISYFFPNHCAFHQMFFRFFIHVAQLTFILASIVTAQ